MMTAPRDGDRRYAFIIGAMKSGTTTLFELLCQHPEISGCRVKEPDYFTKKDAPDAGWEEYRDLWEWDPTRHRVALEASTAYAKSPLVRGVPERIAKARDVGDPRFIYVTREPLSRIESQIRHALYEGWGRPLDEDGVPSDAIDFTRYAMQLDRFTDVFPRKRILVLALDELGNDPTGTLRRVCAFLDIEPGWEFRGRDEVRNKGDFFQVPRGIAWLARQPALRSALGVLPGSARRALREGIGRLFGDEERSHLGRWRLSEAERRQVLDELKGDMVRLHREWDIDVESLWSIPRSGATRS